MSKKVKLIVVAGPTASGKTALGVELAKAFGGEVISADSMQVYKEIPIASAAPTKKEMGGVPHHLIGTLSVEDEYSVADFVTAAGEKITKITERGNIPIIVGGTGLFIDSLVEGTRFSPVKKDEALREKLEEKSGEELYEMLLSKDPAAAKEIHPNNKKRLIRAIEICEGGITKTRANALSKEGETPYETLYFVIAYNNREGLYERIDKRVEEMLAGGLLEEVKRAYPKMSKTALQAIGPKELQPYFKGEISLEEAKEEIKRQTHRYAKRQETWFRRRSDAVVLPGEAEFSEKVKIAKEKCGEFING